MMTFAAELNNVINGSPSFPVLLAAIPIMMESKIKPEIKKIKRMGSFLCPYMVIRCYLCFYGTKKYHQQIIFLLTHNFLKWPIIFLWRMYRWDSFDLTLLKISTLLNTRREYSTLLKIWPKNNRSFKKILCILWSPILASCPYIIHCFFHIFIFIFHGNNFFYKKKTHTLWKHPAS